MKKIINNKVYDTETAKQVGYHDNGLLHSDLGCVEETLYQKKTGEFFLYGWGGAMTNYSSYVGFDRWSSGEMIIPLPIESAKKWAKENLASYEYEAIFGSVLEDETKKSVNLWLTAAAVERMKRMIAETDYTSMSDIVEDALAKFF